MKQLLAGILTLFFVCSATAQQKLSPEDEAAIKSVFKMTEDAWNAGDIDRFMEGYWKSDRLVFVGSGGPTYGWAAIRDNYKKRYPDQAAMGKLQFEILDIRLIDTKTVLFIGKFHLTRTIGDLQGHYTLVWQKLDGKWVIIGDHSSADN